MSRTVTIPIIGADPFEVRINNINYAYKAGTTQTVPDEVADVIDNINRLFPQERRECGSVGQVLTKKTKGADWEDVPKELPTIPKTLERKKLTAANGVMQWLSDATAIPIATTFAPGTVKMALKVSDATSDTIVTQFNALLDALIASGALEDNAT